MVNWADMASRSKGVLGRAENIRLGFRAGGHQLLESRTAPHGRLVKVSSYRKMNIVILYCLRFRSKQKGPISVEEMDRAKLNLLQAAQQESFPEIAGC